MKTCGEARQLTATKHMAGDQIHFRYRNNAGVDVGVFWVDQHGSEAHRGVISSDGIWHDMSSWPGHLFYFTIDGTDEVIMSYMAKEDQEEVEIEACQDTAAKAAAAQKANLLDSDRWDEFESLVTNDSPCEGTDSTTWSCVRKVSPEETKQRIATEYGFLPHDVPSGRRVGQTMDPSYGSQSQAYMINVTEYDKGYLKMKMSKKLQRILWPWYNQRLKDSVKVHESIAGGYTNIDTIPMSKIDLDFFPEQHTAIIREMKQILEWWTKTRLKHTATFGARIYHRGAMLINHVDRQDTHVASAVLQVSQSGMDENGGWPLEILHPHHPGRLEVYMQPGEMVLYEGARIHHGRPMRLKGDSFGNIFSHFSPMGWHGPSNDRNPFFDINKRKKHHSEL